MITSLTPLTTADRNRAVATIVTAFAADPVVRWMYPDTRQFLEHFPHFVRAFGGKAFDLETAEEIESSSGVALWLPPGAQPDDDAVIHVLDRSVSREKLPEVFSLLESMGGAHPDEPHWYLPLIGVGPSAQGRGLGTKLMHRALARCDADRLPAYLESSNPRNVPFYERLGFKSVGRIQCATSPPVIPMLRKPR